MAARLHTQFLEISKALDKRLWRALDSTGPVVLSQRRYLPLPVMLCRSVAGQQLSVKAAGSIWSRVLNQAGTGDQFLEFVAGCTAESLRSCGLSGAKVKAMKAIANAHFSDLLRFEDLKPMEAEARKERLMSLWGIGHWTADMCNMFYFGEKDIWPSGDVTVINTLQSLTGKRRKPELTAGRFAPNRSYLALYMWRIADAGPLS